MKYFSVCKVILLLFAFFQAQGANIPISLDIHLDECMINTFGVTADPSALAEAINQAPMSTVIEAFIKCPNQMSYMFYDRIKFNGCEEVVRALTADKFADFYNALRSIEGLDKFSPPIPSEVIRRESTLQTIFTMSFAYDIPYEYYFDLMRRNPQVLFMALVNKTPHCHTPEQKNWIIGLLNDAHALIESIPHETISFDKDYFTTIIGLIIKLINNEEIDENEVSYFKPNIKFGIAVIALPFNRYEVAEKATDGAIPLSLELAATLAHPSNTKTINDIPRAFEVLKKLLPNDAERALFDEYVQSNGLC